MTGLLGGLIPLIILGGLVFGIVAGLRSATANEAEPMEPAEVAKAVLWMASDDSGMMTGAVIHFDQSVWGGYDGQAPAPAEPLTA